MAGIYQRPFTCPVVVGRAAQLAVLDQRLAETRAGQGLTLLIAGEAGAGESRLIAVAKTRAAHLGLIALQGNCFEPDRVLPFAPIADLLRAVGPAEVLARRLGPAATALRQLLPELVAHAPAAESIALDADHERRRLFEATATLLTELAAEQPLLIAIEDIHWADDASLDLLLFLARRAVAAPLLLVLTYRAGEVQPGLRRLLAGLDRERPAAELTAAPLSATEVAAMIQATLGPAQPVRVGLIEAVQALTEGNPFFVEEVLKSLAADEALDESIGPIGGSLQVPRTVQDAVQGRVERLSPAARETLTWAAVAGRHFDFVLLQTVTRCDELDLLAQMKELLAANSSSRSRPIASPSATP